MIVTQELDNDCNFFFLIVTQELDDASGGGGFKKRRVRFSLEGEAGAGGGVAAQGRESGDALGDDFVPGIRALFSLYPRAVSSRVIAPLYSRALFSRFILALESAAVWRPRDAWQATLKTLTTLTI